MISTIDLDFRPPTYFRPRKLDDYLLSKVKGAVVRRQLQTLYDAGAHEEVRALLTAQGVPEAARLALEASHPMFMGGNYLPDHEDGEVEVARISINSTTYDVTCVFARQVDGVIHCRVVDEYEGETLQGPSETSTRKPMTLGEFTDFFLTAWPLIDVLEMNFGDDLDASLAFFHAESEFYPAIDQLCRQRVIARFQAPVRSEDLDD